MNTKFTPGPWVVDAYGDVTANGEDVARIATGDERAPHDARLIAAAPMLLEACELFAEYDSFEHDDFETMVAAYASVIEAARAAIAAATGETK